MPKSDPLADAIDAIAAPNNGGQLMKIDLYFGDRPAVLESIRKARRDRHLSFQQIATALSGSGQRVSAGAVQNWLNAQGID